MKKLRPVTFSFSVLLWIAAVPARAASPEAPRCDKWGAEATFSQVYLEHYGRGHWKEAIPGLEEAAGLCPKPDGTWVITIHGFGQTPYLPFFYLGRCHFELKEHPDALRQFHLSECFDKPAPGEKRMKDLDSMAYACMKNLRGSQQRPFFSEGLAAFRQKEWEESAEKMWDSLQARPDEGEITLPSGRFPVPYLPRFQLAKALSELGCQQQACKLLEMELVAEDDPRVGIERKEMLDLRARCAAPTRRAKADEMTCLRWACWLKAVAEETR